MPLLRASRKPGARKWRQVSPGDTIPIIDRGREWWDVLRRRYAQRWLRELVISTLAALLLSNCGGGGSQEAAEEQAPVAALDAVLEKSFEESAAPGVVAAVQTPEYTWVRALGVADRTSEEPMTLEVHHRIGSVTKTFTGTLLLQVDDEGLFSLDDTIDRYVAGVPNGDKIPLRQMANHTSGIASYTEDEQFGGASALGIAATNIYLPKIGSCLLELQIGLG